MPASTFLLAALAAVPALVSAHGHVVSISVNGAEIAGFQPANPSAQSVGWATTVTDNGFVLANAINSPDIVCHRGATNARNSARVAAGDSISIKWDTWPASHVGPIIDYLAPCNGDCSTVDKTSLEFFKIKEGGLKDGRAAPGKWVTDDLIANGFTYTTTIPASLAPGNYVLRHEIIALHEGNRQNAAQLYPQCINIQVTGTGTAKPAGVRAQSLYTASDAGIFFDVYKVNSAYPIPGPRLSIGGGSAPAPAPAPTSVRPAPTTVRPAPTTLVTRTASTRAAAAATTTRAAAPTQPATGGSGQGAALYAQCGGQGFTGATTCARGTCTKYNDWYSQCI